MRVLVVDGDPVARRATIRMVRGANLDAIGRAPQSVRHDSLARYEAIIVGAMLGPTGECGGVELVRELRARRCEAPILLAVDRDDQLGVLRPQGLDAGAQAVVVRDGLDLRALVGRIVATRPRGDAFSELPAELQRRVRSAVAAKCREGAAQAEAAFELARLAQSALAFEGPGSAVAACARALGMHRTTLQSYAQMTRWTELELRELLVDRRNVHGEPISVSHLALLAPLPRARRAVWIERVFAQGMTAHELRQALREERRARPR